MKIQPAKRNPIKKRRKNMHCPYLQHNDNSCDAVEPQYNPSEFEVDEYCATEHHLRCPLYQEHLIHAVSMFLKPRATPESRLIKTK
jgi:hypothetical protein